MISQSDKLWPVCQVLCNLGDGGQIYWPLLKFFLQYQQLQIQKKKNSLVLSRGASVHHLHKLLILLVKNRLIPGGEKPWGLPKLVENANDYVPDVHQKGKKHTVHAMCLFYWERRLFLL